MMHKKLSNIIIAILLIPIAAGAQQKDSLMKKLDSLHKQKDITGKQVNNTNPAGYNETTKITFKNYFILLGSDLKQQFTKPFHSKKKDWWNLVKFWPCGRGIGFCR
jgi:hypothetical protein